MYICVCVCVCVEGCLDKYISTAIWPLKQKFLALLLVISKYYYIYPFELNTISIRLYEGLIFQLNLQKLSNCMISVGPFSVKQHTSLIRKKDPWPNALSLRGWAWFTAAKLGWFRTKLCAKHESYSTYILTHRKYIRIAWQRIVKNDISNRKKKIKSLQQNVFLATKISEEIFFVANSTTLATKYEFRH